MEIIIKLLIDHKNQKKEDRHELRVKGNKCLKTYLKERKKQTKNHKTWAPVC